MRLESRDPTVSSRWGVGSPRPMSERLKPLRPLLGTWDIVGELVEDSAQVEPIRGVDRYMLSPDGYWIVHEADLAVTGRRSMVHELIGGVSDDGTGWLMYVFDSSPSPNVMTLRLFNPDVLFIDGEETRGTLHLGSREMFSRWEYWTGETWLPLMRMAYTLARS